MILAEHQLRNTQQFKLNYYVSRAAYDPAKLTEMNLLLCRTVIQYVAALSLQIAPKAQNVYKKF